MIFDAVEALIKPYGVPGLIVAGLAALICIVVGSCFAGEAFRRAANWPKDWGIGFYIFSWAPSAILAAVFFGLGFVAAGAALEPIRDYPNWLLAYSFVAIFGGAVGAAELIARYRDRPYRAVRTAPAVFYIALNALAACAALYLIYVFRDKLGFTGTSSSGTSTGEWPAAPSVLVQAVLLAGFSSLLFFRTSLFKLRVGEDDLSIGPSIVLDTLLAAADRAVDRVMAEPRAQLVHELMGTVSFGKAVSILPGHCLALMQNVSSDETQRIIGVVNSLRANSEMPDKIKSLNLGLALLTVVGEDVLRTAVKRLEADLQDSTAWLLQEVAKVMGPVLFEQARKVLPSYCFGLWPKPIEVNDQTTLASEMTALAAIQDVPKEYKSLILGIRLVRLTDGSTLRKAVDDLGSIITKAPDAPAANGGVAGVGSQQALSRWSAILELVTKGKPSAAEPAKPAVPENRSIPAGAAGSVADALPEPDAGKAAGVAPPAPADATKPALEATMEMAKRTAAQVPTSEIDAAKAAAGVPPAPADAAKPAVEATTEMAKPMAAEVPTPEIDAAKAGAEAGVAGKGPEERQEKPQEPRRVA
jgi:hypothetical protein